MACKKQKIKNRLIGLFFIAIVLHANVSAQDPWSNPIVKKGRLGSPLVESSPFVFNDRLYLMESNQRFWDLKVQNPEIIFMKMR